MDQIADSLHGHVARSQFIGTALEFPDDEFRVLDVVLVFHLMFQAGPGIHGNRAQLDFGIEMTRIGAGHIFIRLFQFQNDVVTAIAVRFDVADIIFLFDDADAIEAFQEVDSPIDVVEKTTDDTDADGIADTLIFRGV